MNHLQCQHENGWAGIAAALALAQNGDEITIESGDYVGSQSLNLPAGVFLRGSDDPNNPTRLYFGGHSQGIRLADDCAISHLTFDVDQTCGPQGFDHVDTVDAANVSISDCLFHGRTLAGHGVYAYQSQRLTVTNCTYIGFKQCALHLVDSDGTINGCQARKNATGVTLTASTCNVTDTKLFENLHDGLVAFSSNVELNGVDCSLNGTNGIRIARSPRQSESKSNARITNCFCTDNASCGILLASASADISASQCSGNLSFGIALIRDSDSPTEASEASINNSHCSNNTFSGIIVRSGSAEMTGNDCCHNKNSGIALVRDTLSPSEASHASINGNHCTNNTFTGIALQSGTAKISGNDCCDNEDSGIDLMRDAKSPTEVSQAEINNNRCNNNSSCGIIVRSGSAEITGNDCCNNKNSGITLVRDTDSPAEASQASINNNHCSNNELAGIIIQSGFAEITGNDCSDNQASGIALVRDSKSPADASQASINNNHCSNNQFPGIAIQSGSAEITGNDCCNNNGSGIALTRDSDSPTEASQASITNNHCSNNQLPGITIQSGFAEITGNDCSDNQGSGIALVRDSKSPADASQASINNNHCSNSKKLSGITIQSGSAKITGNDCCNNNGSGIALTRDSDSPTEASQASINNNHCRRNTNSGITLHSAIADIINNDCHENFGQGITLTRDFDSIDESSAANIARNRCDNNTRAGIVAFSSSMELNDNYCWSNEVDRPCIEHLDAYSAIGAIEHSHFTHAPKALNEITHDRLSTRHNATLIKDLRAAGADKFEAIADYIWSGGSRPASARLWQPSSPPTEPMSSDEGPGDPSNRRGNGVSRLNFGKNGLRMERIPDSLIHQPDGALGRLLTSLQGKVKSPRIVHGTIAASATQIAETAEFWGRLKNHRDVSEATSNNNLRIIRDNQYRVAEPIVTVAPHPSRDPRAGIFSDVLADRSSSWADRTRLLSVPILTTIVATAIFLTTVLGRSDTTIAQWASDNQLSLVISGLIMPGALIFLANLLLPRELKIGLPLVERFTSILSALFDLKILDNVRELLAEQQESIDRLNWWRWAKPHLLGPSLSAPHLLFIGISNVDIWTDGDLWRLHRLLDGQYPEQGLLLAIQTSDHSMVPSAILRPLYEESSGGWIQRHSFVDLLLIETAGSVSLIEEEGIEEHPNDDNGLHHILGNIADRATLLHPRWSIVDLLPALVLGSQTEAQAFFPFSKVKAFELIEPDLREALTAMVGLFSDAPQELQIDAATFAEVLSSAEGSMAILISQSHISSGQPKLTLAGLASYRRSLANQLIALCDDNTNQKHAAASYLAKCLAWGEERHLRRSLHHLAQLASELDDRSKHDQSNEFVLRASWHMRAAGRLAAERKAFADHSRDEQIASKVRSYVEPAWAELAASLCDRPARTQTFGTGYIDTLAGSFLNAVAKAQNDNALDFAPFENGLIEREVLAALTGAPDIASAPKTVNPMSVVGCFLSNVVRTLEALLPIDRTLSSNLLSSKLAQDWFWAPGYFSRACTDILSGAEATSLTGLLCSCQEPEDVVSIVHKHRSDPSRMAGVLVGVAARHVRYERDKLQRSEADGSMTLLGKRMAELINAIEKPDDNPILENDFLGVPFWLEEGSAVVNAVLDERHFDDIAAALSEPIPTLNPQVLGFTLGPMTGVTGVIDDLIAIERRL